MTTGHRQPGRTSARAGTVDPFVGDPGQAVNTASPFLRELLFAMTEHPEDGSRVARPPHQLLGMTASAGMLHVFGEEVRPDVN